MRGDVLVRMLGDIFEERRIELYILDDASLITKTKMAQAKIELHATSSSLKLGWSTSCAT